MQTLLEILMERDGLTKEQAEKQIADAREDLMNRLAEGDLPYDLCGEWWGLEPDYLEELI